jgi:hypothetical protein
LRAFLAAIARSLPAWRPVAWLGRATRPVRQWGRRVAEALASRVPLRVKVWWCVRCAARQDQAEGLCRVVRRFACRYLDMPPNAPLVSIAERIQERSPGTSLAGLQQTFQALDRAAYSGRHIDMRTWKREFRRRFGRALTVGPPDGTGRPRRGLPELNP